jgi:hypothetical protein
MCPPKEICSASSDGVAREKHDTCREVVDQDSHSAPDSWARRRHAHVCEAEPKELASPPDVQGPATLGRSQRVICTRVGQKRATGLPDQSPT